MIVETLPSHQESRSRIVLKTLSLTAGVIFLCGASLARAETWETLPRQVASPKDNPSTPAKIELGKKLFFDPRLSLTGTVSCNTCHNIMEGGDDGRATSMGIHGLLGPRNAPTVWNSAFQGSQFWDGRSPSLEDQAKGPIVASPEMGMPSHDLAMERIKAIPGYQREFSEVFGEKDSINIENTTKAIAAFERTLITPGSPFDRFVEGDAAALTAAQIRGMKLFESTGCTECHSGPALNGWKPGVHEGSYAEFPRFRESGSIEKYELDKDPGRFEVTKKENDKHRFKVPTLRNITLTGPYFHNGKVDTLQDAIRIMAETQLAVELSSDEVNDIAAFLEALEGPFPELTLPRLPSRSGQSVIDEAIPTETLKQTAQVAADAAFLNQPRGRGRGRGPHRQDAAFQKDHEAIFFLLQHRQEITRKITKRKDGVETLTESKNPKVAEKIREHVAAMYNRVEKVQPIHMRDPLFRAIFGHAKDVEMKTEATKDGIRVIETSKDPYVAKLIQAHAEVVSRFIQFGHEEVRKNHALP
jgi:cytochrome c peroxidase